MRCDLDFDFYLGQNSSFKSIKITNYGALFD